MRRSLSGLVLGLALLVGSLSWASFVLTQTVMDPGRSEALADELVDNESVRSALIGRIAEGLSETLPDEAPVPRQALNSAASDALDEPTLAAELKRAIVLVHQNALNGVEEDVMLDASVLGIAARDRLVGDRPELDGRVPDAPELQVELPTAGLAFLGTIREGVLTFTLLSAIGASLAALFALIMAKNRPAILRRLAFWAFGTAAFWLIVGFGVPFAAELLAPASAALISGIVQVFFGEMIPPAIFMAASGAVLLVISAIWPGAARRRPAKSIHARPIDAPPVQVMTAPQASPPSGSNVRNHGAQYSQPAHSPSRLNASSQAASQPQHAVPAQSQPLPDRTTVMPATPSESPFANPSYEPPSEAWTSPTADSAAGDPTRANDLPAKGATATVNPNAHTGDEPHPQWKPGVGYVEK